MRHGLGVFFRLVCVATTLAGCKSPGETVSGFSEQGNYQGLFSYVTQLTGHAETQEELDAVRLGTRALLGSKTVFSEPAKISSVYLNADSDKARDVVLKTLNDARVQVTPTLFANRYWTGTQLGSPALASKQLELWGSKEDLEALQKEFRSALRTQNAEDINARLDGLPVFARDSFGCVKTLITAASYLKLWKNIQAVADDLAPCSQPEIGGLLLSIVRKNSAIVPIYKLLNERKDFEKYVWDALRDSVRRNDRELVGKLVAVLPLSGDHKKVMHVLPAAVQSLESARNQSRKAAEELASAVKEKADFDAELKEKTANWIPFEGSIIAQTGCTSTYCEYEVVDRFGTHVVYMVVESDPQYTSKGFFAAYVVEAGTVDVKTRDGFRSAWRQFIQITRQAQIKAEGIRKKSEDAEQASAIASTEKVKSDLGADAAWRVVVNLVNSEPLSRLPVAH